MLCFLAAIAFGPQTGMLVIDGLGIGITEKGKWRSMDSITSPSWPKKTVSSATVDKLVEGGCFDLRADFTTKPSVGILRFNGDEMGPGDRGWVLIDQGDRQILWFGPKPAAPKAIVASNSSATYVAAVRDFLKSKKINYPKPVLQKVILTDLDGNGTQEALIVASSRPDSQMAETIMGLEGGEKTSDFSLVIVRYLSGKTVKVAPIYYADARKGGVEGIMTFAGLWNLDGLPGLEILVRWRGYEAWSSAIWRFSNGKLIHLAEAGDGV